MRTRYRPGVCGREECGREEDRILRGGQTIEMTNNGLSLINRFQSVGCISDLVDL